MNGYFIFFCLWFVLSFSQFLVDKARAKVTGYSMLSFFTACMSAVAAAVAWNMF